MVSHAVHDLQLVEASPSISSVAAEERNRVIWSHYVLRKLLSCARPCPSGIVDEDIQVLLPREDTFFDDSLSDQPPTLQDFLEGRLDKCDRLSAFGLVVVGAAMLGRCAEYLHYDHDIRAGIPPWRTTSRYVAITSLLFSFDFDVLPKEPSNVEIDPLFVSERVGAQSRDVQFLVAKIIRMLCHCLVNHPFVLVAKIQPLQARPDPSFLHRAFRICRESARAIIALIKNLEAPMSSTLACIFGYCTMVAGTIHALYLTSADVDTRTGSVGLFEEVIMYLQQLSLRWKGAKRMVDLSIIESRVIRLTMTRFLHCGNCKPTAQPIRSWWPNLSPLYTFVHMDEDGFWICWTLA